MKNFFMNVWSEKNERTDLLQKGAWRFVRAAEDLLGSGKGDEKRSWAIRRLKETFQDMSESEAEDYVRAAFMNFKIESSVLDRRAQK